MLEPAFIPLQAIMNKAPEVTGHYQVIPPPSFPAMPCLSGHGLTNQSVWPFCQAEVPDHQRKHALGTVKQVLMDEGRISFWLSKWKSEKPF